MEKIRVTQIVYNWFSTSDGERFYDYTVGKPSTHDCFYNFLHYNKIVKNINIQRYGGELFAEIEFEDGTKIKQTNINSWSEDNGKSKSESPNNKD